MFFEDTLGYVYPVSRIVQIGGAQKHPDGFGDRHMVWLTGDEKVFLYSGEVERLKMMPVSMCAAAPETYIVGICTDPDGSNREITKTPVIAWALGSEGYVTPVTAEGLNDGNQANHAILMPNGQVQLPLVAVYDTLDDFAASEELSARAAQ